MENSKNGRNKPMRVLHLAMPRTGSLSMMSAYETFGWTTYHGFQYVSRPRDQRIWRKAIDAKFYGIGGPLNRQLLRDVLDEFEVVSDFPCLQFAEELIEMYPDAKVVLVGRDIDNWYHSFNTQIIASTWNWMARAMLWIEPLVATQPATTMHRAMYAFFESSDREGMERNAKQAYQKHYEKVRRLVPKERLLEYKLGSGWEPLCEFFGKPIPDEKFPFKNDSEEFTKWVRKVQAEKLKDAMQGLLAPSMVLCAAIVLFRLFY